MCIHQTFAGQQGLTMLRSFRLACRASLNHPCPSDGPCWHDCSQLSLKEFASVVRPSLKTGLCHGSNKSSTDKSLGRVHLSKNQTSDVSDVPEAQPVLDREPDGWKGKVDGINLSPRLLFSLHQPGQS